jgi:hypothetical protein
VSESSIQKWVLAITAASVVVFILPPVGLALYGLLIFYGVRCAASALRVRKARKRYEAYARWRGDPWNQQFMQGNGDDGGLSIAERNAYRKSANKLRR